MDGFKISALVFIVFLHVLGRLIGFWIPGLILMYEFDDLINTVEMICSVIASQRSTKLTPQQLCLDFYLSETD